MSKGVDPIKSNRSKECMIFHYWFLNHGFKFEDSICCVLTLSHFDIA